MTQLHDRNGNPVERWCAQDVLDAVAKLEAAVPGIRCRISNNGLDLWCEIGIPAGRVGCKGNPFSAIMVFAIDDAIDEPSYGLRRDLDEVTDFFLTGTLPASLTCGYDDELNKVRFAVANQGNDVVRTTSIERGGVLQQASRPTPIRRR